MAREELQQALSLYTRETLKYIDTVRRFCESVSKWMLGREEERNMMRDIKARDDKINLKFSHVTESEEGEKGKAFWEFIKNKFTPGAEKRRAALQEELAAVLQDTLGGLEELRSFLEAVEKLAVTSLHVFMPGKQVISLPKGISLERVQAVILAARQVRSLLLVFKRDDKVFFSPRLQNVEVLAYQLDQYIKATKTIRAMLEKSSLTEFCLEWTMINVDSTKYNIQRMLHHIQLLDEIRKNQNFRMVFLFQEESSVGFIGEFSKRKTRMLQCLNDLEEPAVQLDNMNKGAKISSVAGSSVGAVGGVISIVGLALIPFTAGVSTGLIIGGAAMGGSSALNSLVTTITELGVNSHQQGKASEVFQSFMEDVQVLQVCLEEVSKRETQKESPIDVVVEVGKVLGNGVAVAKGIDGIVDGASAFKALEGGKAFTQEGRALGNVSKLAEDLPDIGQAALKGPLALSKAARAGLITVNALFIGMDVFFICKDSIGLANGSETELSKFIRARAVLWNSEIDAWQTIHDSLKKGLKTVTRDKAALEESFYPEKELKEIKKKKVE